MADQKWPFVPAEKSLPELTTRVIVIGIFLGMVMTAANAYLGMKVGMTVSASIPAAVMSMLILRGFRFKDVSILENNAVQTMASAGESLAAGVIFTVPALLVMGIWDDIDPLQTFIIAFLGGVLGTMFTIALRRVFIVEEALPYPEGVACTEVLIAGEKGGSGLVAIIYALIIGAMYGWVVEGLKVTKKGVHSVFEFMGTKFYAGSEMSLALLSVGYIVGLRIASFIFIGGILGFGFLVPIFGLLHGFPSEPLGWDATTMGEWHAGPSYYAVWSGQVRYIGAGAMVVGGVWTLWSMRSTIFTGFSKALNFNNSTGEDEVLRTDQDTDMRLVLSVCGMILILSLLFFIFNLGLALAIAGTLFIAAVAFFFSAVAGYIAGVVGSSNSPVSGMTIATLMFTAALVFVVGSLVGANNETMMFATLMIASVVAVNAAIAGDVMQDLKTGNMVGATPWRQQIAETIGVIVGAAVIGPVLLLLNRAFKITITHCEDANLKLEGAGTPTSELYDCSNALLAPQADLIGTIIESIFGGSANVEMLILGGLIAALLVWRKLPVMSVAIGIYLPIELSAPIFTGGLIHYYITNLAILRTDGSIREKPSNSAMKAADDVTSRGVLIGAGFIAGESLVGVFIALLIVTPKIGDPSLWFGIPQLGQFPTLMFFMWFVGVFIFLTALSLPKKIISIGEEIILIIKMSILRLYDNILVKK
ncbi:MAG: oligopeptide transporter, OPT family [Euryarchaeota archaeon]|nr:oligopeptide transporter, OPT family [Euryarchaeota archaeon]|tara:strand:- start:3792 stop:5903 length:2112 start_codon:yes stop_codon:yes gene_type:complete